MRSHRRLKITRHYANSENKGARNHPFAQCENTTLLSDSLATIVIFLFDYPLYTLRVVTIKLFNGLNVERIIYCSS